MIKVYITNKKRAASKVMFLRNGVSIFQDSCLRRNDKLVLSQPSGFKN